MAGQPFDGADTGAFGKGSDDGHLPVARKDVHRADPSCCEVMPIWTRRLSALMF